MNREQKKNLYGLGVPIIIGTILLIGVSYAWLSLTLNGTKENVLKAGILSLVLEDKAGEGIQIEGAVPMLDEVGLTQSSYRFTLTNNGTVKSGYTIYLDDVALEEGEEKLPDGVIKYNLERNSTSMTTELLSTTGSNPNRVLDSGVIKPNEAFTYDLRLWLDQDATLEEAGGKVFKAKIRVVAEQIKEIPVECFVFDESSGTIVKYLCGANHAEDKPEILDVVIPKTINGIAVTSIGSRAFMNNQLTSVVIPDSVTQIINKAFAGNQLTSVEIPDSVTNIVSGVFNDNQLPDKKAFIYARNNDGSIDDTSLVSYGGKKRDHVVIPNNVKNIGQAAFQYNQLISVTIPDSVTSIGQVAFQYNQLTSVTIPDSVIRIERYAFSDNQLTNVIIKGKSSSANFSSYPDSSPFGWASGYSDDYIIWQS